MDSAHEIAVLLSAFLEHVVGTDVEQFVLGSQAQTWLLISLTVSLKGIFDSTKSYNASALVST